MLLQLFLPDVNNFWHFLLLFLSFFRYFWNTFKDEICLNQEKINHLETILKNHEDRLQKLENNDWNGAIFAKAGLERINILPSQIIELDWMLPAPAQGAMLIVGLEDDEFSNEIKALFNKMNEKI